jgi:hypothetical protein
MEIGIVGLPNVGKSTLFNALARAQAPASNYPYCTIDPNVAVVEVRDRRLPALAEIVGPDKLTHPMLRFVDIAGLPRGASTGEGLGNLFLSHIRGVDAIAHVMRCFTDPSVVHVEGDVDPLRDLGIVETELFLSDVQVLDRRIAKLEKVARTGDQHALKERDFLASIRECLDQGKRFDRPEALEADLEAVLREMSLLSLKPVMLLANIGDEPGSEEARKCASLIGEVAAARGTACIPVSAKLEAELGELSPADAALMTREMGFEEGVLERFVRACYDLLQVITFFTIKGEETRGWTVRQGTTVRDAAGRIHTDMRERFICAEVIGFDDFIASGGMSGARDKGLVRTEGRDYIVGDGDIVLVRFGK